jgi:hypothetical protein
MHLQVGDFVQAEAFYSGLLGFDVPDIEQALIAQARQQGTTPEQLAFESLRRQFVLPAHGERAVALHGTLADFLDDSIGTLHSSEYVPGGARMSQTPGKMFLEGLLKKWSDVSLATAMRGMEDEETALYTAADLVEDMNRLTLQ